MNSSIQSDVVKIFTKFFIEICDKLYPSMRTQVFVIDENLFPEIAEDNSNVCSILFFEGREHLGERYGPCISKEVVIGNDEPIYLILANKLRSQFSKFAEQSNVYESALISSSELCFYPCILDLAEKSRHDETAIREIGNRVFHVLKEIFEPMNVLISFDDFFESSNAMANKMILNLPTMNIYRSIVRKRFFRKNIDGDQVTKFFVHMVSYIYVIMPIFGTLIMMGALTSEKAIALLPKIKEGFTV